MISVAFGAKIVTPIPAGNLSSSKASWFRRIDSRMQCSSRLHRMGVNRRAKACTHKFAVSA
jgi:hypothetical protein